MFAVPGWSLPSNAPKQQKLPISNASDNVKSKDGEAAQDSTQSSKKRKRKEKKAQEVNSQNLADIWGQIIEGNEKPKQKEVKKVVKSEERPTNATVAATTDASTVENAEAPRAKTAREEQREKKREKKRKLKELETAEAASEAQDANEIPPPAKRPQTAATKSNKSTTVLVPAKPAATAHLTPLQASMRQKLISARFRHLNQELYTTPSKHSLELFAKNPEMFQEYHEGFRRQVEVWPENPVDGYIAQIKARGKVRNNARHANDKGEEEENASDAAGKALAPLPRTSGTCVIADLGCGDAALATDLTPVSTKKLKLNIHSYDLQSPSPLVTKADIANLPLANDSVDVAIFCLALMGTNWIDFIEEAYRILRWKGELWISEIKSRFGRVGGAAKGGVVSHSVGNRKKAAGPGKKELAKREEETNQANLAVQVDGNDAPTETDVSAFVEVLSKRGFVISTDASGRPEVDLSNRMFVKMCFYKAASPIKGKNVKQEKFEDKSRGAGKATWTKKLPKRYLAEEEDDEGEGHVSSETAVLKPCVYKIR